MAHMNGKTSTDKPHKSHRSSNRSSLGPRRTSKHSSLGHVSRNDNNYHLRATRSENIISKSRHHQSSETDSLSKPLKSKSSKLKKRSKGKGKDRESEEDIILLSSDSKRKLLSLNGDTNKSWLGEAVRTPHKYSQYGFLVLICHRPVLLRPLLSSSRKRTTGRFTRVQVV